MEIHPDRCAVRPEPDGYGRGDRRVDVQVLAGVLELAELVGERMRFLWAFFAIILWLFLATELYPGMSDGLAMLTASIVAAGALAGGD